MFHSLPRYLTGWKLALLLYAGQAAFLLAVLGFGSLGSWATARQLANDYPYFLALSISMGEGQWRLARYRPRQLPRWVGWLFAVALLVGYTLAVALVANYLFLLWGKDEYLSVPYVLRKSIAPYYTAELLLGVHLVRALAGRWAAVTNGR
jgi:hypothetical protein